MLGLKPPLTGAIFQRMVTDFVTILRHNCSKPAASHLMVWVCGGMITILKNFTLTTVSGYQAMSNIALKEIKRSKHYTCSALKSDYKEIHQY